jgi:hypothetical protein
MDASRGCIYKKVCWRWNGDSAVSECIQDCIHYTKDKSLTPNNSAMLEIADILGTFVSWSAPTLGAEASEALYKRLDAVVAQLQQ